MKSILHPICAIVLVIYSVQIKAQCTISGFSPSYCVNSASSTLSFSPAGGTYSASSGMLGSVFVPSLAAAGTVTLNYNTSCSNYSIFAGTYAPLLADTAGNYVTLGDDDTTTALPIGFNFTFFCNTYSNFFICSNGFITFKGGQVSQFSAFALPSTSAPLNMIGVPWTDLTPNDAGTISYTTVGTSPNRILVVSYNQVYQYDGGTLGGCCPVTVQLLLYETTNVIEIHSTAKPIATSFNEPCTMGIQDLTGTNAYVVTGRNGVGYSSGNEMYRFTPLPSCSITQTTAVYPATISVTGATNVCNGSSSTLTALSNTSYTWSGGTTSNASSVIVAPTSNTTYSVAGKNSFGCLSNTALTITVTPTIPVMTITPASSSVCAGKSATLTATGANSYTWTGGITNGVSFIPPSSSVYTVTGSNICGTSTASRSVTVNALPTIGGSVNNPTICSGNPVIFNGTGSASGYTWTGAVTNNTSYTPAVTGNYTVTGASAQGCTNTAVVGQTVLVTPNVPPVASSAGICTGSNGTLSALGATGYTWNVSPPAYTSSIVVSPTVGTTYTLNRVNGACASTATIFLNVYGLPNMAVAPASPSVACAGNSVGLFAYGSTTYTWYPGGFTGASQAFYPNASRVYTVVTSNANCTFSLTSAVTINPPPTINVNASALTICDGSAVTLTASGANSYTWNYGPTNTQTSTSISISDSPPAPAALYNVSGTDANGCVGYQSTFITVNAAPNLTASILNPGNFICAGVTASLVTQGTGQINYSWSNGATTPSIYVSPAVSTNYTVTAINPSTGCKSVATLNLAVFISTFVVTAPPAFCVGQSATLTATGAANSYSWSTGANTSSIAITPPSNGVFYVTGTTSLCTTTQSVNVVVNPLPTLVASLGKITICRLEPGSILTTGSSTSFLWSTGANTSSIVVTPTVTTNYTVSGTDTNGCVKTVTITQYVASCTGIEEFSENGVELLNIYPNPNNGDFIIQAATAMNISIVNETGQVVKRMALTGSSNQVNLNTLANGIYFIVAEKDGHTATKKMVVSK